MQENLFKRKHTDSEIILLCARWYLKYSLSLRNLQEIMAERGIYINYSTIHRLIIEYAPILNVRMKRYLRKTNDSLRMDETYIKVNGEWVYLYWAIDTNGDTIDFRLLRKRDKPASKHFFRKALRQPHVTKLRVISTDKYAATEYAIIEEQASGNIDKDIEHRKIKYLNNIVEQDYRHIKRITNYMLGFKDFDSASRTIMGVEAMHMIHKNQTWVRV